MARGQDKTTGPGAPVSRKNSKSSYQLQDFELESIAIVKDSFEKNKKFFQHDIKGKKGGRVKHAFRAFWREIAGLKEVSYHESDLDDFMKHFDKISKKPGLWAVNAKSSENYNLDDLAKKIAKEQESGDVDKDFMAAFLSGSKDKAKTKSIMDDASKIFWTINDNSDGQGSIKISQEVWKDAGKYSVNPLDAYRELVDREITFGQHSFFEEISDDAEVAKREDFWREFAAQKKLPFVHKDSKNLAEWMSSGKFSEDLKHPAVFNIEINNDEDVKHLMSITQAAPDKYGTDQDERPFINIIDRRGDIRDEERFRQAFHDRVTHIDLGN